jgi:predicted acylesterase/phospholipase RssA
MDITAPPTGRARLLAFDGGGIRGLFSLEIAKRIETLLREKHGRPDLVLADHFHYIGGTSTGAIIATFLSWGMPVAEVIRLYRENSKVMFTKAGWAATFKNRFAGKPISDFLRNFFVESDGTHATLGSSKLRTLLLVVRCRTTRTRCTTTAASPAATWTCRSGRSCGRALRLRPSSRRR